MSTTKSKKGQRLPRRPEKKFGPFLNGLGIAIWLNCVETANGPRYFRSNVVLLVMWRRLSGQRFFQIRCSANAT
jgi:hypothetical protein